MFQFDIVVNPCVCDKTALQSRASRAIDSSV